METAGKPPSFKEAVRTSTSSLFHIHGHVSGFSEALYAAMGKKSILNIVSIHNNDERIDVIEGARFSDLGQLFACARYCHRGSDGKEMKGDSLGKGPGGELGREVSAAPAKSRPEASTHPTNSRTILAAFRELERCGSRSNSADKLF
jgi:hypothetical protein